MVRACATLSSCQDKAARLAGGPKAKISDQVSAALQELPGGYADLAKGLRPIVAPRRVLITEYFNPTRDDAAQLCRRSDIGLDAGEFAFAAGSVLRPLNDAVAAAAHKNGWTLVPIVSSDFREHGYCSRDRWVVGVTESLFSSSGSPLVKPLGTLHPNANGQLAISARIAPPLATTLWPKNPPRTSVVIPTNAKVLDDEDTPWWHPRWLWLWVLLGIVVTWPALLVALVQVLLRLGWILWFLIVRPAWLLLPGSRHDPADWDWASPFSDDTWRQIVIWTSAGLVAALVVSGYTLERIRLLAAHLPNYDATFFGSLGWRPAPGWPGPRRRSASWSRHARSAAKGTLPVGPAACWPSRSSPGC